MKASTVFILILILIIIGLGGLAWYFYQNQSKVAGTQTQTSVGDLVIENQEAGWQIHSSPLGYSLTYPAKYFQIKNQNENLDLFYHEVGVDEATLPAGSIYVRRQPSNIKDINQIYTLLEKSAQKESDGSLLTAQLVNKKNLTLEDGTEVIEYDQTGVEDFHNIIVLNGGYLYNLGYKSKNADTLLVNYFNKMYPTIKFAGDGAGKIAWKENQTALGFNFKSPEEWVVQESSNTVAVVSPNQDVIVFKLTDSLNLSSGGKSFVLSASGKRVEGVMDLDTNGVPNSEARGRGNIEKEVFFDLRFDSDSADFRSTDWKVVQEILKSVTY